MPFDIPTIKGTISPYRSLIYQTFAEHVQEAIAAWLLEQLKTLYPTHSAMAGSLPIYYSYFFDLTPKQVEVLELPAVAVDVVLTEHPKLGSAISDGNGGVVAGALADVEIAFAIFAGSARFASSLERAIASVVDRIINHTEDIPILFFTKYHMADDRGFRTLFSFDFPALWQALPDEVFVKITYGRSAVVEEFIDDVIDNAWTGVVGGFSSTIISDDVEIDGSPASSVSLSISFTPSIP